MKFDKVYLHGCRCMIRGEDKGMIRPGLYEVIEHVAIEPSAYVWSPYVLVLAEQYAADEKGEYDDNWEDHCIEIDADDFYRIVYPKSYGRMLVQERELELDGCLS